MKMKRLLPIFLSLTLLLSSCTSLTAQVEELLSAPVLRADQKEIVSSLEKAAGDTVTLKYPTKGTNISPFLSADFDLDGEEEVIAFYQKSAESKVHIAMMDKDNGKWNCLYSVEGEGTSVLKTDLIQLTGEAEKELVVGFIDASGKGKLSIYRTLTGQSITTLQFMDYDIISYGAGINDQLMVVDIIESATKSLHQKVSCYRYNFGGLQEWLTYTEDTVAKTYQQIECIVRPDFSALIYLDVLAGNEVSTEVLKIENEKLYPVLDSGYTRTVRIYCRDINDDGILEIPAEVPYARAENAEVAGLVLPVRWSTIKGDSIQTLQDSIINTSFGYYIDIPEEFRDKIFFTQNATGNLLTAYVNTGDLNDTSKELYSIKAVYRYEESPEGYTKIGESQSVYFYAKINSSTVSIDGSLEMTYDALSGSLKLL